MYEYLVSRALRQTWLAGGEASANLRGETAPECIESERWPSGRSNAPYGLLSSSFHMACDDSINYCSFFFFLIDERELKSSGDRSRVGSRYSAPAVSTIVVIGVRDTSLASLPQAWNHNNERFKSNKAFQPVNVRRRCLGRDLDVDFGKIQRRKRISRAIDLSLNSTRERIHVSWHWSGRADSEPRSERRSLTRARMYRMRYDLNKENGVRLKNNRTGMSIKGNK